MNRSKWLRHSYSVVAMIGLPTSACGKSATLGTIFSDADKRQAIASTSSMGEGIPLGVKKGMTWRLHGRINTRINPKDFEAFIPWGQVFPQEGKRDNLPASVELRRMRAYILSLRSQCWILVSQSDRLDGRLFQPNYDNNESVVASVKYTDDLTSARLDPSRPFHFWPKKGRVAIDGSDVGSVLVIFQARMAPGSPRQAHYLVSAGADYWKTITSRWQDYTTNGDAGIGRFTQLTSRWQNVFMFTGERKDFARCIRNTDSDVLP